MTSKSFHGTAPILPPGAARDLDRREFKPMHWDEDWDATAMRVFRDLKKLWKFEPQSDVEWGQVKPFTLDSGKTAYEGNCNDFAPELRRRLIDEDFPPEALRLVLCLFNGQGHMVLSLETDRGSLIFCPISGAWDLDDPAWEHYEWIAWETAGRAWESLRAQSLKDIVAAIKTEKVT